MASDAGLLRRALRPFSAAPLGPEATTGLRLSEKACTQLDKLLDEVRFDATRKQLAQPFGPDQATSPRAVVASREARSMRRRRRTSVPRRRRTGKR